VKDRADLLDGLVSTVPPGTVSEEDQGKLAFGVDPQRGSGVAQMPDQAFRKTPADDDSSLGVSSPRADRPGRARKTYPAGRERDCVMRLSPVAALH
jgi:hypothetical protein